MNRKSAGFPFLTDFYICHFTTTVLLLCPFISRSSGKLDGGHFVLNCAKQ